MRKLQNNFIKIKHYLNLNKLVLLKKSFFFSLRNFRFLLLTLAFFVSIMRISFKNKCLWTYILINSVTDILCNLYKIILVKV